MAAWSSVAVRGTGNPTGSKKRFRLARSTSSQLGLGIRDAMSEALLAFSGAFMLIRMCHVSLYAGPADRARWRETRGHWFCDAVRNRFDLVIGDSPHRMVTQQHSQRGRAERTRRN